MKFIYRIGGFIKYILSAIFLAFVEFHCVRAYISNKNNKHYFQLDLSNQDFIGILIFLLIAVPALFFVFMVLIVMILCVYAAFKSLLGQLDDTLNY